MADDYTPVAGKYKAMKWDGTNTAAFQAWVQTFTTIGTFAPADWSTVHSDFYGTDLMTLSWQAPNGFSVLTVSVPLGGWAVFGPWWGTDPSLYWRPGPRTPWVAFTDAEFGRQYVPAV